jgi:hypothetical protein
MEYKLTQELGKLRCAARLIVFGDFDGPPIIWGERSVGDDLCRVAGRTPEQGEILKFGNHLRIKMNFDQIPIEVGADTAVKADEFMWNTQVVRSVETNV